MLFIVIHQSYELWFKQILHEMDHLTGLWQDAQPYASFSTLKRILVILKCIVGQIDILETMTPLSFASFRDRLESASGFQSLQFRQLEFRLGLKNAKNLAPGLTALLQQPSIYESFLRFLAKDPRFVFPASIHQTSTTTRETADPAIEAVLAAVYRQDPLGALLCERMVDLDEGFQEWRYRHVKMVERTIGRKVGTGGSSGADYLRATLFRPAFPELWSVRSHF